MYCLKYFQKIPINLKECWNFFSDPGNLRHITPKYLNFKILNKEGDKMYPGQIIVYTVRPVANIPLTWVTEITHVSEQEYFIDEQRFGPYAFWHHEHHFKAIENGTEMIDIVYYKTPFGVLGKMANSLKIKHDIEAIFSYRKAILEEMFGKYEV